MNSDGSNPVKLTNNPNYDNSPTWSTDGEKIAFTSKNVQFNIFVMNSDGSNQINLTNSPNPNSSPSWSKKIIP